MGVHLGNRLVRMMFWSPLKDYEGQALDCDLHIFHMLFAIINNVIFPIPPTGDP